MDPLSTADPLVQFFMAYLSEILLSLIGVPVLALLLVMVYNRLPEKKQTPSTTPLLQDKDLCKEVVVSSDNSITIMYGERGYKGYLVVDKPCKAIHVKAHLLGGTLDVKLFRNKIGEVCK